MWNGVSPLSLENSPRVGIPNFESQQYSVMLQLLTLVCCYFTVLECSKSNTSQHLRLFNVDSSNMSVKLQVWRFWVVIYKYWLANSPVCQKYWLLNTSVMLESQESDFSGFCDLKVSSNMSVMLLSQESDFSVFVLWSAQVFQTKYNSTLVSLHCSVQEQVMKNLKR